MTRIRYLLVCLLLAFTASGAETTNTIVFSVTDFRLQASPSARVQVRSVDLGAGVTNFVMPETWNFRTAANGVLTLSNVWPGRYDCELETLRGKTNFTITVKDESGTFNAVNLLSVSTNPPSATMAYAQVVSDARYARKATNSASSGKALLTDGTNNYWGDVAADVDTSNLATHAQLNAASNSVNSAWQVALAGTNTALLDVLSATSNTLHGIAQTLSETKQPTNANLTTISGWTSGDLENLHDLSASPADSYASKAYVANYVATNTSDITVSNAYIDHAYFTNLTGGAVTAGVITATNRVWSGPKMVRRNASDALPNLKLTASNTNGWTLANSVVSVTNLDAAGGTNFTSVKISSINASEAVGMWQFTGTNVLCPGSQAIPHVSVRLFVGSESISNFGSISMRFADITLTNTATLSLQPTVGFKQGWNTFTITPSMWSLAGSNPVWTNVSYFRVGISNPTNRPSVVVNSVTFRSPLPKAKVAITFDDNNIALAKAAAFLSSNSLRATFYSLPSAGGRLSVGQLEAMRGEGHLIANHSWSHLYASSGYSSREIFDEALRMADWLTTNGFAEGASIYAIPGGTGEAVANPMAYLTTVNQVRLTTPPTVTAGKSTMPEYGGRVLYSSSFDDTNAATLAVSRAISDGAVAITGWHETCVNNGQFFGFINWLLPYVKSGQIDVVTVNEFLDSSKSNDLFVNRATTRQFFELYPLSTSPAGNPLAVRIWNSNNVAFYARDTNGVDTAIWTKP